MPNSAAVFSPWASFERLAQRRDNSMEIRATSSSAGYGVHSSKIITMSEPRSRWTCIDSSGPMNTLAPSTGEAKVTPSSLILRMAPRLNTWKPPESVRIGPFHCMKSCRSPCFLITSVPGRSHRWKVLPRMISAPVASISRGSMPLTVP
ncbi:hypothetical protein D3C71_1600180 [compost metagenome]